MRHKLVLIAMLGVLLVPAVAWAQSTGAIAGRVTGSDGGPLPGVTVEAAGTMLPGGRVAVTGANGDYRLEQLPPGDYKVTFTLSGMQTVTRAAQVQLSQDTVISLMLSVQAVTETVTVTATASLIDPSTATIKSGMSSKTISSLPVGNEYRDLLKLIPGVQYSQDTVRGTSAGGSGQDNVYQFDGVNVTRPLFGSLNAEPSTHDIEQVTTIKGGARAVNFERSGGFTIDSVSKSGSNRWQGEVSYKFQTAGMSSDLKSGQISQYEQKKTWLTAGLGGKLIPNKAFFYGSYYRPEITRENRANLYGDLPQYERKRNEYFGKITITPIRDVLLNVSHRNSKRNDVSDLFSSNASNTTGSGTEVTNNITIAEGSWVIGPRSYATAKYTKFDNQNLGLPDNLSSAVPSTVIGSHLDIANLHTQGLLTVPATVAGATAYNAFIQPFLDRYGYLSSTGVRTGGGTNGYASQLNDQDFFRDLYQVSYNLTLGSNVTHELHAGFQWSEEAEHLLRSSNGWGSISVPGARLATQVFNGTPIYFTATFQAQADGAPLPIDSKYRSKNIEFNDSIRWNNWSFNAGVLVSNDTLYGQGLRNDKSTLSGFVSAPGNQYEMYNIPWKKMIQPRLNAVRSFESGDTIYASYARYNPAASSLPRAASWDRARLGLLIDAHFDQNGNLFGSAPRGSSSGKLFVPDMTPRTTDEYIIGTSMQLSSNMTSRVYGRYKSSKHFWEDTNNTARTAFNPPPGIPRTLYIPNLDAQRAQIGSGGSIAAGSTYVIAELDGAYTKYYEATAETEYRSGNVFVRGSYTWSHYFGNVDQDNTTTGNDADIFIGSSNLADGAGRQIWDNKEGDLRGDRRHMLKIMGYYSLPWNGTAGAFFVAQSGQPWEAWDCNAYPAALVGTCTASSHTIRNAEPAGTRITPNHWQMDLKYSQHFRFAGRYNLIVEGDLFNIFNKQTGYNFQPNKNDSTFNIPRTYFSPRRLEVNARFQF
jgi:hypothetical protein